MDLHTLQIDDDATYINQCLQGCNKSIQENIFKNLIVNHILSFQLLKYYLSTYNQLENNHLKSKLFMLALH